MNKLYDIVSAWGSRQSDLYPVGPMSIIPKEEVRSVLYLYIINIFLYLFIFKMLQPLYENMIVLKIHLRHINSISIP